VKTAIISTPRAQTLPACAITTSSKAIMGLKEVVLTKDDDCAICHNALANRYHEDNVNVDRAGSAEPTMLTL
jgi:hypothetical protein